MTQLGKPREISRELDRVTRRIRIAWFDAIDNVRAAATWTRIAAALERGEVEVVAELLLTRAILTGLLEEARGAYTAGASTIERGVPKSARAPGGGRLLFRMDIMDPRAQVWLAEHSSTLVQQILEDQRQTIRLMLARGTELGQNPRATALNIVGRINPATGRREGGVIGLTRNQAATVNGGPYRTRAGTRTILGARGELASGDPATMRQYLRRSRRDRRFDRTVLAAINAKKGLPVSTVDRIVNRYSDRMLQLRGETIARTEAIQAFSAGRHEALEQLRKSADLSDEDMVRRWDATMDRVTREDHRSMDGQERVGDEAFEAPDGSLLMYPGDLSLDADAAQIINCRCMEIVDVDFVKAEARRNTDG